MTQQYYPIYPKSVIHLDLEKLKRDYSQNDEEQKFNYNPFNINEIQAYNPIYSSIFHSSEITEDTALYSKKAFFDMNTAIDYDTKEPLPANIFIKFSPLLDNLRYLMGKYVVDGEKAKILPDPYQARETILKLSHMHNSSYIDNFFCYLTSIALNVFNIPNGLDYYGSYLGIQELYKSNVLDDFDYLTTSQHFISTKGIAYFMTEKEDPYLNYGSRANKQRLLIDDAATSGNIELIVDEIIDMGSDTVNPVNNDNTDNNLDDELVYVKETKKSIGSKSTSQSTDTSNNSELNYSSSSDNDDDDDDDDASTNAMSIDDADEEWEDVSSSNEDNTDGASADNDIEMDETSYVEEEKPFNVYIKDFPMQMIILEKCEGTLDSLFLKGIINEQMGIAMLMQIIMTLLIYQKMFHFTHNDLHTNNVMYIRTKQTHIYYKFENNIYKVPTYGYIYKIIDFGRSIYKFNGQIYCSDSYAPSGDANGQYNFEPFMNSDKPRLEPNYSFDLCRIACSIYDFVFQDQDEYDSICETNEDKFVTTIVRWVKDNCGKNILYKKNGEERYPNFKLYKMIARTVNEHTPYNQLKYPEFSQFITPDTPQSSVIDIDALPVLC